MFIIIGQRIDYNSSYKDIPFKEYHFPKKYRYQVQQGDIFIYYQGDRHKKENRYYYGCGLIGEITVSNNGEDYFAKIEKAYRFPNNVPIYNPDGGYYESIGYQQIRKKEIPAWQNSIRKLSITAFEEIILASNLEKRYIAELFNSPIRIKPKEKSSIKEVMKGITEQKLEGIIENTGDEEINEILSTLDSKGSIDIKHAFQKVRKASRKTIISLKELYNYSCQICGFNHSEHYEVNVSEAHHIEYFSETQNHHPNNLVILCPTHHRLVHAGEAIFDRERKVFIYKNGFEEPLILNFHL
ncbi:HNH endonuclease [Pontibacillus sp. HMF3514]|uniref:HNH endonuclease n=1 Tax=Pontibacillus sp. HMF3514 TaxID=2692425 RepID=UPI00131F9E22|nr:HNH endonuclease [Pontibacillus sp. HMF3514]QHE51674.1 hypothetical protein GS400_06320 [Pontibacillus sp. HMF3514]